MRLLKPIASLNTQSDLIVLMWAYEVDVHQLTVAASEWCCISVVQYHKGYSQWLLPGLMLHMITSSRYLKLLCQPS